MGVLNDGKVFGVVQVKVAEDGQKLFYGRF